MLCSAWIAACCLLAGCKEEAAPPPLVRVRTTTVQLVDFAPPITLTGVVAARVQSDVAFRVGGKIRERLANVGEHVTAQQVLARLDPAEQEAEVASANAVVQSAEALLQQTQASFDRLKGLLEAGSTTRRDYDQAEATYRSAEAQLEQARSQLARAREQLAFTELRAGADGILVERSAEAGQVVAQAQPVFALAHDGGRDAVFNVHEWALANMALDAGLAVSLVANPAIRTGATMRLVSPAVDPRTMTVTMRFALEDTPAAMRLGTLVNGTGPMKAHKAFLLPWSAVFEQDGQPAVWVIGAGGTASLSKVAFDRYAADSIAVTGGLEPGQAVVTAGGQWLRPGQKVEVVGGGKP